MARITPGSPQIGPGPPLGVAATAGGPNGPPGGRMPRARRACCSRRRGAFGAGREDIIS
jgi:hypothetical protein